MWCLSCAGTSHCDCPDFIQGLKIWCCLNGIFYFILDCQLRDESCFFPKWLMSLGLLKFLLEQMKNVFHEWNVYFSMRLLNNINGVFSLKFPFLICSWVIYFTRTSLFLIEENCSFCQMSFLSCSQRSVSICLSFLCMKILHMKIAALSNMIFFLTGCQSITLACKTSCVTLVELSTAFWSGGVHHIGTAFHSACTALFLKQTAHSNAMWQSCLIWCYKFTMHCAVSTAIVIYKTKLNKWKKFVFRSRTSLIKRWLSTIVFQVSF